MTYTDPCVLIRPAWFIALIKAWNYIYMISFPMSHMAVTVERIRATARPMEYERTGIAYGVASCIVVVSSCAQGTGQAGIWIIWIPLVYGPGFRSSRSGIKYYSFGKKFPKKSNEL